MKKLLVTVALVLTMLVTPSIGAITDTALTCDPYYMKEGHTREDLPIEFEVTHITTDSTTGKIYVLDRERVAATTLPDSGVYLYYPLSGSKLFSQGFVYATRVRAKNVWGWSSWSRTIFLDMTSVEPADWHYTVANPIPPTLRVE